MFTNADRIVALGDKAIRRDRTHPRVWWVRSLHSKTVYRVQVMPDSEHATCTCPHGKNNVVAGCYHAAAVFKMMEREEEERYGA